MNTAQRALGEQVWDHLTQHPGLHDQGTYGDRTECGTRACIAGWTVLLAAPMGVTIDWAPWYRDDPRDFAVMRGAAMPGGRIAAVADAAMSLLGITYPEAETLFDENIPEDKALYYLRELLDAAPTETTDKENG